MPTKRRPHRARRTGSSRPPTGEAVAIFQQIMKCVTTDKDWMEKTATLRHSLHNLLARRPWEEDIIFTFGNHQPPSWMTSPEQIGDWEKASAIYRMLEAAATEDA